MEKIKIASKFLTKSQANKQASKERQLLKAQGKNKTHKVEILFAYDFWRTNKWFGQKKFGLKNPTDQDYIIIITEISKPKTINMAAKTQKQSKEAANSPVKSLKAQRTQKVKVPQTKVHKMEVLNPIQNNSSNGSNYSFLSIPTPYFYSSVA